MKALSNPVIAAIIALALTLVVGLMLLLPFGRALEAWTGDKMLLWRYDLLKKTAPAQKPDPHLTLLDIDQQSVSDLGRWPFPRGIHGQFLQVLAPEKPKVVTWDVFFTEKTDATPGAALAQDDQALVDGAKLFPHLLTVAAGDSGGLDLDKEDTLPTRPLTNIIGDIHRLSTLNRAVVPFPELRKISFFGFADADASDLRRTLPLVVNVDGKVFPNLDLQTLMQYWDVDPDKVVVTIGHEITLPRPDGTTAHIPIDGSGLFLVNYRARADDFQHMGYSHAGVGLAVKEGTVDKPTQSQTDFRDALPPIANNIVVVGVNLSGTDNGPIPLDAYSPLVAAHLNILSNILQQDYLHAASPFLWLPFYALFLFGIGHVMLHVMNLRLGIVRMIFVSAGGMLVLGLASFGLLLANEQAPVALPEIGLLLLTIAVPTKGFFGEEREKARIKEVLRANLSEKVMANALAHPDNIKLGGVKQEITIMFCDIRNFTKYCDDRDSAEVMAVLNDYMEVMTEVVFKYDGTVDKYIGDCIMAFWNAPEPQPDHAQRAVCCAMEMRYALANFKTKRAGKDIELFECGIGVHTGEALVGYMGSSLKRNYTAMGSTVNMGARLETLTKRLNERILVSQEVVDQLQGEFPLTDRGEATIPGFGRPIHVYAIGADQDISSALKVGRTIAHLQDYTAEEVTQPIWAPAPLPEDADPNP